MTKHAVKYTTVDTCRARQHIPGHVPSDGDRTRLVPLATRKTILPFFLHYRYRAAAVHTPQTKHRSLTPVKIYWAWQHAPDRTTWGGGRTGPAPLATGRSSSGHPRPSLASAPAQGLCPFQQGASLEKKSWVLMASFLLATILGENVQPFIPCLHFFGFCF